MNAFLTLSRAAALAGLSVFAAGPAAQTFSGYAEGEYARLAPREGGILQELRVRRGDRVKAGDAVAVLESGDEKARLDEARARLAQTDAQLADLRKGKRTPEIDGPATSRVSSSLRSGCPHWFTSAVIVTSPVRMNVPLRSYENPLRARSGGPVRPEGLWARSSHQAP